MSQIKALDKLREWSRWLDCTYATDDGESYIVYSHQPYDGMKSCGEYMREQCDEIEREIQERYMLLPEDADGVPIRPGDQMTSGHKRVDGLGLQRWDVVAVNGLAFGAMDGTMRQANCYRHVKPRTLEDVLCDMIHEYGCTDALTETIADKYAAEIRELLGGDAE